MSSFKWSPTQTFFILYVDYASMIFGLWDIKTNGLNVLKAPDKIISADLSYDSKYILVCTEIDLIILYAYVNTIKHHSDIKISHKKAIYLHDNDKHLYVFSCGTSQHKDGKSLEIALHKIVNKNEVTFYLKKNLDIF